MALASTASISFSSPSRMSLLKSLSMISLSRGSHEIHLSLPRPCSETGFLSIDSTRFQLFLLRRPFTEVLCDSSFYTEALLTPTNPGLNDPDEQKTGYDGQNNEQIKISFRHCPCVSARRQSNAGTATKLAQNCADWCRLPEKSLRWER